jgi:hypothetical protein
MPADASGAFLEYHEPSIISILTLLSFFLFLAVSEWLSDKIFRAGLIGQIVVGLIYGVPIANILALQWQEAFLALGYIGLILIIFEGTCHYCHYSCFLADEMLCRRPYHSAGSSPTEPHPKHHRRPARRLDAHFPLFCLAICWLRSRFALFSHHLPQLCSLLCFTT